MIDAGLRVTGTLGLLRKAKRFGRRPSMAAAIDERREAAMRMGDALATNILVAAGEPEQQFKNQGYKPGWAKRSVPNYGANAPCGSKSS
jgi:hypothetical protein